ncbi:hypothetical protein Trydic_g3547 [Trypoxylus dichotomus]
MERLFKPINVRVLFLLAAAKLRKTPRSNAGAKKCASKGEEEKRERPNSLRGKKTPESKGKRITMFTLTIWRMVDGKHQVDLISISMAEKGMESGKAVEQQPARWSGAMCDPLLLSSTSFRGGT